MNRIYAILISVLLVSQSTFAQVDEIKAASSGGGGRVIVGEGGGSSGSGFGGFFFQLMFGEMFNAQHRKLRERHSIPSLVSLDVLLQAGGQPSSYYIVNPRIRGNWGLFSTDFRFNYIIEEDFDRVKVLHTNDWQVLLLNLVTTRDFKLSLGGGFISEAWGDRRSHAEWTTQVFVFPSSSRLGGTVEYRGASARREVNGHMRYLFYEKGVLHSGLTVGAVYQRHYNEVTTWGLQAGVILSIY